MNKFYKGLLLFSLSFVSSLVAKGQEESGGRYVDFDSMQRVAIGWSRVGRVWLPVVRLLLTT